MGAVVKFSYNNLLYPEYTTVLPDVAALRTLNSSYVGDINAG
jgi:hypothetical protein